MNTSTLGEARFASRHSPTVNDSIRIPEHIEVGADPGLDFQVAGPRAKRSSTRKRRGPAL